MELIINIEQIKEEGKKEWLFNTLRLMGIRYRTSETGQTIDEYNNELENGNSEIESEDFTTASELLDEVKKWK
jgi:hypothetical protein